MQILQLNYSNTVFYLKLVLIILGLLAIALIFSSAKKLELSSEIPFANEIDFTTLDDGLTKPLFSSITKSGDEIQIAAKQIISTNTKDTALVRFGNLEVFPGDGSRIILSSDIAVFKKKDNNLTFSENVILESGNDIRVTAPKISTALDRLFIRANGPVNGFFSNSNIKAGQLEIFRENISNGIVISFTKGVKMVYNEG
jgi:hypothetical protein